MKFYENGDDCMLRKIKRILGFCECDKCWNRVHATIGIDIKGKSISRNICEKHMKEIIKDAELKFITVEV